MQEKSKTKILLTGVGGPAGINMARLLKERDDVVVIGCDVDETAAGQFFVDEFLIAPFVRNKEEYKEWMLVHAKEVDLVIPTVDEELKELASFVSEIDAEVALSPKETLEIAGNKLRAYKWMQDNLPEYAPQFISLADWTEGWSEVSELFIKPKFGRGARGCRVVSQTELSFLKKTEENTDDWIVMELLPGTEWTIDGYVAKNGKIVYLTPRERLGLAGGISIKGRTVKNEAVQNAATALLQKLECRGPVCIQFKADTDGNPKFIEINPRLSGGLMITAAAGVDPVSAIFADMNNEEQKSQEWNEVTVVGHFEYKTLR